MHVGFTGTPKGMQPHQKTIFQTLLLELGSGERWLHHGDCIGADAQAHQTALTGGYNVHIHPPDNDAKRAYCKQATTISKPKPYLKRNQAIVDASALLIATPVTFGEQRRSGTWSTIRRARKANIPHLVVWPDGSVQLNLPHEPAEHIDFPNKNEDVTRDVSAVVARVMDAVKSAE